MKKLKLAVAGLGQRGYGMLGGFLAFENVDIVAICDSYPDRNERAVKVVEEKRHVTPKAYTDYEEMLKDDEIEAVYIASSWDEHVHMAILSLYAKKITALEVGGAYEIEELWDLVRAYESTKTPFMFMENCCYNRFELLTTAVVRKGLLGEIVHCHGSYCHDLRDEILGGVVNRHYRLDNYKKRNCENYPTHELGPIAKILDINAGNRFMTVSSFASKASGLEYFLTSRLNPDKNQIGEKFKQGDVVTTVITCANGETITLTLETTLPRFYSREFTVKGTKGFAMQDLNAIKSFADDEMTHAEAPYCIKDYMNTAENYKDMLPDIWTNITQEELNAGHGGMDYLMLREFVNNAVSGKPFTIDVYDAASWMSITALSEQSIALGGMPLSVPDFTKGKWIKRQRVDVTEFNK